MSTPFAALRHRDFAAFAIARFCATLSWQMLPLTSTQAASGCALPHTGGSAFGTL